MLRDGLVNFVFMHANQQSLIDGLVNEFTALGFPKEIVGLDSSLEYFEKVRADDRMLLEARLGRQSILRLFRQCTLARAIGSTIRSIPGCLRKVFSGIQ